MLKEVIDQYYLDRQKDKEQDHFYITDAGRCPRAIFFKFKKARREETEPRILRIFDHGDSIHRFIMKSLLSSRDVHVVASEINIPCQEMISGRADAVISDGHDLYILDIKSMNSIGFRKLIKPKDEHINQIQLYLHFLDPKKGILLYVNKDTQDLKEFTVKYNSRIAKGLLKELCDLQKKIDKNIVPSRIPEWPRHWQCQYCSFKEICKIEGGEIKWDDFKKKIEEIE